MISNLDLEIDFSSRCRGLGGIGTISFREDGVFLVAVTDQFNQIKLLSLRDYTTNAPAYFNRWQLTCKIDDRRKVLMTYDAQSLTARLFLE